MTFNEKLNSSYPFNKVKKRLFLFKLQLQKNIVTILY